MNHEEFRYDHLAFIVVFIFFIGAWGFITSDVPSVWIIMIAFALALGYMGLIKFLINNFMLGMSFSQTARS